jgi:hypothetical protein
VELGGKGDDSLHAACRGVEFGGRDVGFPSVVREGAVGLQV